MPIITIEIFYQFYGQNRSKNLKSSFGYELRQNVVCEHNNVAINLILGVMTVVIRHV